MDLLLLIDQYERCYCNFKVTNGEILLAMGYKSFE